MAVANDIDAVLSRFCVTIDHGSEPPPPPPTTGSIAGSVTDSGEDSAAIAGALVSVDTGQTATTDANGGYTITGVPTGGPVCNGDYYRLWHRSSKRWLA